MSTLKKEILFLANEITNNVQEDRLDIMNIRPHVYFIDKQMLRKGFGLNNKALNEVSSIIINTGKLWKTQGIGGYDIIGDVILAFIYDRPGKIKSFTDNFNSSQINDLHKKITISIEHFSKKGSNPTNSYDIDKGHMYSSIAMESRYTRLAEAENSGKYNKDVINYIKSKAKLTRAKAYNEIRVAIQKELKIQKLNVSIDMVHSYKGPNNEMAGKFVVFITPQNKHLNRDILGQIEQAYGKKLHKAIINRIPNFTRISASPTFLQRLSAVLDYYFIGLSGAVKGAFKRLNPKYIEKKSEATTVNVEPKVNIIPGGVFKTTDINIDEGRFSPVNLMSLLNSRLHAQIQKNMGDGTALDVLNYQTGRFAESSEVVSVAKTRRDHIVVFYNYMKYPYATFDPAGAQYKASRRGPQQIIDQSIRELAAELVYDKFTVTPKVI